MKSLKIIDSGLHIEFPHNFIIQILTIPGAKALFESKLFFILEMLSVEKLTVSSDLLVSFARLLGKAPLLFNRVVCKKSIKKFSFHFKVCYKFIFMKERRNARGIFYYLERFLKWTNMFSS